MAISTAMCTSFKVDLLDGTFSGFVTESPSNTFRLALYLSSATLDASKASYGGTVGVSGDTGEASDTSGSSPLGYQPGGSYLEISQVPTSTSTTAWLDFSDLVFSTVTLTAGGCLIYDTGNSNASISTHTFGSDKSASAGKFAPLH